MVLAAILVTILLVPSGLPKPRDPSSPDRSRHPHHNGPANSTPRPVGIGGHWKLILNSGFGSGKLDTKVWRTGWFGSGTITGPINEHEWACYSNRNIDLPKHESMRLAVTHVRSRCEHKVRPFTGAVLSTNPHDGRTSGGFTYRYGVLEARVYLPPTSRSRVADWPGVIALGQVWPRNGEDDVMENLDGVVCSRWHSPGFAPGGNLGACDPGFTAGWHIVSSNWEPGSVTWYYDGIEVAHADHGITSAPMYLVLVNTVSSKAPDVAMPDAMKVAYVRVWQRAPAKR